MSSPCHWQLYILSNVKGMLYTGITTDVSRRLHQHNRGQGAKSLRGKGPFHLVYRSSPLNQSEALRFEYQIKQLKRTDKLQLIQQQPTDLKGWLNRSE